MNAKRRRFCIEYIKDANATQAAIRAGYSKGSAHVTGSRLLSDAKVQKAIELLRAPVIAKAERTLDNHLAMLETLRDEAREKGQISAAVNAETAYAKVRGWYSERHTPDDLAKLSDDELERLAAGQPVKLKLA